MLRSYRNLTGYGLQASDGEIGRCKDFLFDDQQWVIRYMVADTRKWLPGRRVLVSPISLGKPDWRRELFPVELNRDQIKHAPSIDEAAPVSREQERIWSKYYGYGSYWAGAYAWGAVPLAHELRDRALDEEEENLDPSRVHIRSCKEVDGYEVHAMDGMVGTIYDFIIDDTDWSISDLLIETTAPAQEAKQRVFCPPQRVTNIDWARRVVSIDVTKDVLRAWTQASSRPAREEGSSQSSRSAQPGVP